MISSADFFVCLQWYGVLFILGLLGLGIYRKLFGTITRGGYLVSKSLGLVALTSISWVLSTLNIVPFNSVTLWILALLLSAFSYKERKIVSRFLRSHAKDVIVLELIVMLLFSSMVMIRAHNPRIEGIEKYMDSGILQSLMRTEKGVPEDHFYAGKKLNYYYFGHYMVASVAKMSHTKASVAFNLGSATVVALAGASIMAVGLQLGAGMVGALLSVFLALFLSNLHPFLAFMHRTPDYMFFNSGRFIEYVINEYPLYSIILGDLHAHFLALIITTLLIFMGVVFLHHDKKNAYQAAAMGWALGLLAATNAFDVISFGLFSVLIILFAKLPAKLLIRYLECMAVGAIIPFGVFFWHFRSPDGGLGIALWKTPTSHILMQFGGFFIILGLAVLVASIARRRSLAKGMKHVLLVIKQSPAAVAITVLFISGMLAMLLPQIGFLKDIYYYQNPPFSRANTQFKLWYSAWIFLSVVTGTTLGVLYKHLRVKFSKVFFRLFTLLCIISLSVGTVYGLLTLKDNQKDTIDGLEFLNQAEPDKLKMVRWIEKNVDGQKHIVEAVGDSYSRLNWLSSYTGLPTIMGWRSHEWGWRYGADTWSEIVGRQKVVESIYKAQTPELLRGYIKAEHIDYILVGVDERQKYDVGEELFYQVYGSPVVRYGSYALFKTER